MTGEVGLASFRCLRVSAARRPASTFDGSCACASWSTSRRSSVPSGSTRILPVAMRLLMAWRLTPICRAASLRVTPESMSEAYHNPSGVNQPYTLQLDRPRAREAPYRLHPPRKDPRHTPPPLGSAPHRRSRRSPPEPLRRQLTRLSCAREPTPPDCRRFPGDCRREEAAHRYTPRTSGVPALSRKPLARLIASQPEPFRHPPAFPAPRG